MTEDRPGVFAAEDPVPTRDPSQRLADVWRLLAESEFRDYCPIYERIALAIADDADMIARLVGITDEKKIEPVLCLAAIKHLGSADPGGPLARAYAGGVGHVDPWPPFRALLVERFVEVAGIMRTRSIQTNEVGRASASTIALGVVAGLLPAEQVHLVEIGPSAGLNLALDRFRIDYRRGDHTITSGPVDAEVTLTCVLVGPTDPPIPPTIPPITGRRGVDPNPLDVGNDDHMQWLEACLWPGVEDRLMRFRSAVRLARLDPPQLVTGSAPDTIFDLLDATPSEAVPVVLSTWVLAYLAPDDRARTATAIARWATERQRPVAAITLEYPSIAPWIPAPPRPAPIDDPRGASLLGVGVWGPDGHQGLPLAWVQAHGQWIDWFENTPAATATNE